MIASCHALFSGVRGCPQSPFVPHRVRGRAGRVSALTRAQDADVWINAGFFIFRPAIFEYLETGDELVERPFSRLIDAGLLYSYKYRGFWVALDTYKDKVNLDRRHDRGDTPWVVWKE